MKSYAFSNDTVITSTLRMHVVLILYARHVSEMPNIIQLICLFIVSEFYFTWTIRITCTQCCSCCGDIQCVRW